MSEQQESRTDIDAQLDGQRANALLDAKDVEYYSQASAAWFNSALEHDKSLLTLSVAGIGFLVSIMSSATDSIWSLLFYMTAMTAFAACIISVLRVFKGNKKHILDVLSADQKDEPISDPDLEKLDKWVARYFSAAVLLSSALGFSAAIATYQSKGDTMATEGHNNKSIVANDSVNGLSRLSPRSQSSEIKSFSGMSQLQPKDNGQANQTAGGGQPSSAPIPSAPASSPKK